jgi:hypothetical protein
MLKARSGIPLEWEENAGRLKNLILSTPAMLEEVLKNV